MKAVQVFLVTKTRTKNVNCNSHKENCKNFLISNWNLGKIEEHFPFSLQTCDHFIAGSWIYEAYYLLNLFNTPLQIYYGDMNLNNLSSYSSLALLFVWKLCWSFLLKVVTTIFVLICFLTLKESTCEKWKNIFPLLQKRSWNNQVLTFQILKCRDVIKCPSMKLETNFTD